MSLSHPCWATPKQKEGMNLVNDIAREFLEFSVTFFQPSTYFDGEENHFIAKVSWIASSETKDEMSHDFKVGWNVEESSGLSGESTKEWQFIFGSDGECIRNIDSQVFFFELFNKMNKLVNSHYTAN